MHRPYIKILLIFTCVVSVLLLAACAAFFITEKQIANEDALAISTLPEFVNLDPLTINLQAEENQLTLQATISLEVPDRDARELFRQNMPKVRNRLILLLSSKKPSELATDEDKKMLAAQIITILKSPLAQGSPPQQVEKIVFTSFVIDQF
jgi:flagellar FliL protein